MKYTLSCLLIIQALFLTSCTKFKGNVTQSSSSGVLASGDLLLNLGTKAPFISFQAEDNLFFFVSGGCVNINCSQLWKTDGSPENTKMVAANLNHTLLDKTTSFQGELYFVLQPIPAGPINSVWHTSGLSAHVRLQSELPASVSSARAPVGAFKKGADEVLVFLGTPAGATGVRLFAFANSPTAVVQLPGEATHPDAHEEVEAVVVANERLYYALDSSVWMTDGTIAGTQELYSDNPGIRELAFLDGHLYFSTNDNVWKIEDGGTITPILTGSISGIFPATNKIFVVSDGSLWVIDSSGAGHLKTIIADVSSITLKVSAKVFNDTLIIAVAENDPFDLFPATDVYRSDGTMAGTHVISGLPRFFPDKIFTTNSYAYLSQVSGSKQSIWKTDSHVAVALGGGETCMGWSPFGSLGAQLFYLEMNCLTLQFSAYTIQ